MKGSPVFFIIFIRPTMQHQPPHHPPYAFLRARLTFAYEEYLHVRVEVTRERIWKSQDAHRARNNTRCKNEIFHPVRTKYHAHRADIGQTPRQMLKKPSILKKSPKHFALSPKSHYFAGWIRHLKIQTSKTEHRSRQKMPPYIKGGRTIKKDSNLIYSYTPIGQSLPRTGSLLMRPFLRSSPRPAVSPLVLPSFLLLPQSPQNQNPLTT